MSLNESYATVESDDDARVSECVRLVVRTLANGDEYDEMGQYIVNVRVNLECNTEIGTDSKGK